MNPRLQPLEPRHLFANGDPVESFGHFGVATTPHALYKTVLSQVAATPDGKVLAAVQSQKYGVDYPYVTADFVRFTADGQPDTTFGGVGAVDSFFATVRRIAVRSDGRFYALGSTSGHAGVVSGSRPWFVARFLPNGAIDPSFGNGGSVPLKLTGLDEIDQDDRFTIASSPYRSTIANTSSFLDADGRLTLLATDRLNAHDVRTAVVRFDATGALDPAFNRGRPVFVSSPTDVLTDPSISLGPDGSVLVAGNRRLHHRGSAVVRKLSPAGGAEAFGAKGFATFADTALYQPRAVFASDGGVYVAGSEKTNNPTNYLLAADAKLARLTPTGQIDSTFAGGGLTFPDTYLIGQLVPTADGGVITRGTNDIRRWNADGTVDDDFGRIVYEFNMPTVADGVMYGLVGNEIRTVALGGNGPSPIVIDGTNVTLNGSRGDDDLFIAVNPQSPQPGYASAVLMREGWGRNLTLPNNAVVTVNAGPGNDTIGVYTAIKKSVQYDVFGGRGDDYLDSRGPRVTFHGGPGNDSVDSDAVDLDVDI